MNQTNIYYWAPLVRVETRLGVGLITYRQKYAMQVPGPTHRITLRINPSSWPLTAEDKKQIAIAALDAIAEKESITITHATNA